jgi:protein O-mannosyl-transferase
MTHKALELEPEHDEAQKNLSRVLSSENSTPKTLAQRRNRIRACAKDTASLNETAWVLATGPESSLRNGVEALDLAQRAVELSDGQEPAFLDTLAAAYAEAGRFAEAVQTAEKAAELATQQKKKVLADAIKARIRTYKRRAPFRQD